MTHKINETCVSTDFDQYVCVTMTHPQLLLSCLIFSFLLFRTSTNWNLHWIINQNNQNLNICQSIDWQKLLILWSNETYDSIPLSITPSLALLLQQHIFLIAVKDEYYDLDCSNN